MREQPTKALILRRLRVRIDGRPGGRARAVMPNGRTVFTSGRRGWAVEHALTWRALGYDDVQIAFSTPPNPRAGFRPFPATQEEAIQAIRELAAGKLPSKWRRLLKRIDKTKTEETNDGTNQAQQT
jgi:hypothetical protein